MMELKCEICNRGDHDIIYNGPIRSGGFGEQTINAYKVYKCRSCEVAGLYHQVAYNSDYYENDEYVKSVDKSNDIERIYDIHSWKQKQLFIEILNYLDKGCTIADIGCGPGILLDLAKGFVKQSIGVEPSEKFRKNLKNNGHLAYSHINAAVRDLTGKIDIIVCFNVIEHVPKSVEFLVNMRKLLSQNGKLFLLTPNLNQLLMVTFPDIFAPFFFRIAHLWYFNYYGLKSIFDKAGFKKFKIESFQLYGQSNYINWLITGQPKGNNRLEFISHEMDYAWRSGMKKQMKADFLFAIADKD